MWSEPFCNYLAYYAPDAIFNTQEVILEVSGTVPGQLLSTKIADRGTEG